MNFIATWDQPEHEFLDGELQKHLKAFYDAAFAMGTAISLHTVPAGGGDFISVYADHQRSAGPRPLSVVEDAAELNKKASEFVQIYDNFLRFCRAKLEA